MFCWAKDKDALHFIEHFCRTDQCQSATAATKQYYARRKKIADADNGLADRENTLSLRSRTWFSKGGSAQELVGSDIDPFRSFRVGDLYEKENLLSAPAYGRPRKHEKMALKNYLEPHVKESLRRKTKEKIYWPPSEGGYS